jgi:hypothetical protein
MMTQIYHITLFAIIGLSVTLLSFVQNTDSIYDGNEEKVDVGIIAK